MASNLTQMIDEIEVQLLLSTFVTDANNVFAGEIPGKPDCSDSLFPRLEYQMHEENNFEYINQTMIQPVQWFSVSGYIRVFPVDGDESDAVKAKARLIQACAFFRETITNIFEMNYRKLNNTLGIDGFIQIHSLYHAVAYQRSDFDSFVFNFGMDVSRPFNKA